MNIMSSDKDILSDVSSQHSPHSWQMNKKSFCFSSIALKSRLCIQTNDRGFVVRNLCCLKRIQYYDKENS